MATQTAGMSLQQQIMKALYPTFNADFSLLNDLHPTRESCFNDWAGTRAREAKSRDARTIFFSDVSLDGLAERTNCHLGEMILQDVLYRLCHSNQC